MQFACWWRSLHIQRKCIVFHCWVIGFLSLKIDIDTSKHVQNWDSILCITILWFFLQFSSINDVGALNRITFQEVYTKTFKCEYQLQLYPFDTQVLYNLEAYVLATQNVFWKVLNVCKFISSTDYLEHFSLHNKKNECKELHTNLDIH